MRSRYCIGISFWTIWSHHRSIEVPRHRQADVTFFLAARRCRTLRSLGLPRWSRGPGTLMEQEAELEVDGLVQACAGDGPLEKRLLFSPGPGHSRLLSTGQSVGHAE